jgi:hypothetical protein
MLKTSIAALALGLAMLAGYAGYLYLTYIDEMVHSGSAYGFTIGQSKSEAFAIVADQFAAREIAGVHIHEPFSTIDPVEGALAQLSPVDSWVLFPGERDDFFDVIKLGFESGELSSIYRHRKHFEFP